MALGRVFAVWEATEVLDIRPPQPHIEGHVISHTSHHTVTPEQMWVVAVASLHRRQTSKIFRTLIHQVAWNLVRHRYSEAGAEPLQDKAKEWPDLQFTIEEKLNQSSLTLKPGWIWIDLILRLLAERAFGGSRSDAFDGVPIALYLATHSTAHDGKVGRKRAVVVD
ncbi:hypothetical protein LTR01_008916 [Friedmanniomyces endolithicus]|nr:hypothetical protein LTR01_008916 [Friedmanniomyces endolithicus]